MKDREMEDRAGGPSRGHRGGHVWGCLLTPLGLSEFTICIHEMGSGSHWASPIPHQDLWKDSPPTEPAHTSP